MDDQCIITIKLKIDALIPNNFIFIIVRKIILRQGTLNAREICNILRFSILILCPDRLLKRISITVLASSIFFCKLSKLLLF